MKNNNGKVAIAIVAMFVVALSVVGFTYAYFTAQVQGNQEEVSVDVGAGIMKVSYDHTAKLAAVNLVPGWISDGYHYYDPILSVKDEGGIRKITAATLDADGTLPEGSGLTEAQTPVYSAETPTMVSQPVEFTVTNTGNQTAKYAIQLTNITNNFNKAIDENNLLVYLFEGEWNESVMTPASFEGLTPKKVFDATDGTLVLSDYEELAVNGSQDYYVVLYYQNVESSQNDSMGKNFSASVEIVGLGQDAEAPAAN